MKESTSIWKLFGFKAKNLDSIKSWWGYLVTDWVWEMGRDWTVFSVDLEEWELEEDAMFIPDIEKY